MTTKIEWCDEVWNPVVGCTPVSAGCDHCYARRIFNRNLSYHSHKFEEPTVYMNRMEKPFHWRKPRRVFVNSMSDLFHPDVPFWFIYEVFELMTECSRHTFMVLTKRPERMLKSLGGYCLHGAVPARNIWLGVTAENQATANERIPLLLQAPAAVRFVSVEPMLEKVHLYPWLIKNSEEKKQLGIDPHAVVDWVICGGETGPGARMIDLPWVRLLRDHCGAAGIPFFFKGWGGANKKKSGRLLDGLEWDQFPEVKSCTRK